LARRVGRALARCATVLQRLGRAPAIDRCDGHDAAAACLCGAARGHARGRARRFAPADCSVAAARLAARSSMALERAGPLQLVFRERSLAAAEPRLVATITVGPLGARSAAKSRARRGETLGAALACAACRVGSAGGPAPAAPGRPILTLRDTRAV